MSRPLVQELFRLASVVVKYNTKVLMRKPKKQKARGAGLSEDYVK